MYKPYIKQIKKSEITLSLIYKKRSYKKYISDCFVI